jgi:hypothetical protein
MASKKTAKERLTEWEEWGDMVIKVLDHYRINHNDTAAAALIRIVPGEEKVVP